MEVFTWGIEFNVWLQTFSNLFLDALFKAITFMGNEEFYLILLPLVYWCFDKRIGVRLTFLMPAGRVHQHRVEGSIWRAAPLPVRAVQGQGHRRC